MIKRLSILRQNGGFIPLTLNVTLKYLVPYIPLGTHSHAYYTAGYKIQISDDTWDKVPTNTTATIMANHGK